MKTRTRFALGIFFGAICGAVLAALVLKLPPVRQVVGDYAFDFEIALGRSIGGHLFIVLTILGALAGAAAGGTGGASDRLADSDVPNEPQNNGENLVFLHGYNVNPQQARGVESEMFKRFYWSGSMAKFYGVTWNGAVTQGYIPGIPNVTTDLQTNEVNALLTASSLAAFLGNLSGETTVAAHSLGNMVVLSAISDYGATPSHYFMIDSAVAMEAIDGTVSPAANMINSQWTDYTNRLWASEWHDLFPTNDARSKLTWNNRLGNLASVDIYNFYSSGEEVLREQPNPTPSLIGVAWDDIFDGTPVASYLWALQEKEKGLMGGNEVLSSDHGGWKFNDQWYGIAGEHMAAGTAALLPDSQLQTNAFFDVSSDFVGAELFTADTALYGSDGSAYAAANRDRILSDAIPALTLPAGANVLTILDQPNNPHNFDMTSSSLQNGWPEARFTGGEHNNNWYHSDFDYVAYPFTCKLFEQIVTLGNLK